MPPRARPWVSLTAKVSLGPLLLAQALLTRARMPRLAEAQGPREGCEGEGEPLLRLLVAGDSSAAGVGVEHQRQALAQPMARHLSRLCRARVGWRLVATSGLTTGQLLQRLQAEPPGTFDVAVVVTGVNDVIEQVPTHLALSQREALADTLRNTCGVRHVAFTPLPPVHRFTGLPEPLRWVAGGDALRHNQVLREWAATRGDVSVLPVLPDLREDMMAVDGFHPGEPVYRAIAEAMADHLVACVAVA